MKIQRVREAITAKRIRITDHADEEANADQLKLHDIYHSVQNGEVIEDYPTDRPFPSCLIFGFSQKNDPIHSVWSYNNESKHAILITVYRPDPDRWINWKERGN